MAPSNGTRPIWYILNVIGMLLPLQIEPEAETPLYRQLHDAIRSRILSGALARGERLPPTRELAGSLGLNRATVAAAYELLESEGLIRGHVGRGSFVEGPPEKAEPLDWESVISAEQRFPLPAPAARISFSASRPSELLFPLDEFRATCQEAIQSDDAAQILQLGPAAGYGPLRRYLLEQARQHGTAGPDDDVVITSGCQQAFDLIQRVLASRGETVLLEDPVYPGLRNVFLRGGARVVGVPVGDSGVDVDALAKTIDKEHPRLMVLTPNFQNPTGTTMAEAARKAVLAQARRAGVIVIEDDLYTELRYRGTDIPSLKSLDPAGGTILLSSFSKIAFPGLRVGWAIGPRRFIARLIEAKALSDLHSDQLSQAVLLRFASSGRLAVHREKMIRAGAERLHACLAACATELPPGIRYTQPEGGMNLWVRLPEPLDAAAMAASAERDGVSFFPGAHFAVSRPHKHSLRLSFAGLDPRDIATGLKIIGRIFRTELQRARAAHREEAALV